MNVSQHVEQGIKAANRLNALAKKLLLPVWRRPLLKTLPFWSAAIFVGICSAGYAVVFDWVSEISASIINTHPLMPFLLAPLCFVVAWWLVHRFAPDASGSGIPQVIAATKLVHKNKYSAGDQLLGLKTAFIKILSSLVCILAGGAVGREGPTIQIASSIFYFVGRKSKKVFEEISLRPFIVAGGAAGVASAFNTPLGGIVFAVEELAKSRFHIFKGPLIFAVVISGIVTQFLLGPYLYFGFPSIGDAAISALPLAILVGGVAGLAGALFGKMLALLIVQKNNRLKTVKQLACFALFCGIVVACLSYFLGISSIGPGKRLINDFLFHGASSSWEIIVGRYISPLISYLSGAAGGIFAPSLAAGAAIGQKMATMSGYANPNLMVLMGMIAFLTGVTGAPFTSFVLVLEMTDRHSAIFFMMLSAMIAHAVSKLVGSHSFYEIMEAGYISQHRRASPSS